MALGGWMSTSMQHYLRKNQLATDGLSSKLFGQEKKKKGRKLVVGGGTGFSLYGQPSSEEQAE